MYLVQMGNRDRATSIAPYRKIFLEWCVLIALDCPQLDLVVHPYLIGIVDYNDCTLVAEVIYLVCI